MTQPWLAAILALVLAALTLAAVTYSVIANLPRGLILAALLAGAGTAGWYGLIRRGSLRVFGLGLAATLVLTAVLIVILDGGVAEFVVVGATAFATVAATKAAFAIHVPLPGATDPARPVLFYNPKSGGGKAEQLDLGVDRNDVVGALDAFVDGGERTVDLAEVNGRVFVNNVSLGLYAEAVQAEGHRDAKLRTILDTLPDVLGPEGEGLDLRWTGLRVRIARKHPGASPSMAMPENLLGTAGALLANAAGRRAS